MSMIKAFNQQTIESLAYYVYALIDPRDNRIFYIGKGKGNFFQLQNGTLFNENGGTLFNDYLQKRYKEYDGGYLGHYAQWIFWFFFVLGFFLFTAVIVMMFGRWCHWF